MFYNLGAGGDGTNNPNWAIYPQNALIIGEDNSVLVGGSTPLRPAEHMSPATYNIWRNVNFGHEQFPSNLGVRELIKSLVNRGANLVAGDVIGLSTIPHLAIVRGVMLQVNAAQAGTVFNVIRASTGEVLIANVDASDTGVHFVETSGFVVRPDTNDSIAIEIVSWPEIDTSNIDPCGVYGPCDDFTLCLTVNAFIWSPVAADFCKNDPCFGAKPYKPYVAGEVVDDREEVVIDEPVGGATLEGVTQAPGEGGVTVTGRLVDGEGEGIEGLPLSFSIDNNPDASGFSVTEDGGSFSVVIPQHATQDSVVTFRFGSDVVGTVTVPHA